MNDFGVPMNDAELSMVPNPGKVFLQEQLATSGMEMSLGVGAALVLGSAISVGGSMIGGSMAAGAARDQAEAQNKATEARYQYDLDMWSMKKQQLQASRQESIDELLLQYRNEGKIRAYKDAAAQDQYDYNLKIRDTQQAGNEAAFQRSEEIYNQTTNINAISAKAAMDSQIINLDASRDEARIDRNDSYLEMLQNEGKLRARGASGRSAAKGVQATMADYGRQVALLNAADDALGRNTRAALNEIIRDKTSADLTAYASKMLEPGELPDPVKPQPIPIPEFRLPRVLQEYDFGPEPVKGAFADPGAAASRVWGSTITSIAGSIGQGMMGYAAMK